jgi:polysaccharide export outer membrane protein
MFCKEQKMKFCKKTILLSLLVLGISACSTTTLPPSKLASPAVDESGQYTYRIGSGDVLSVFVWGNPDITGDYSVRPDGKISMALTSSMVAAGKTVSEIEKQLTIELVDYIKNPKVTVMIKDAAGSMVERIKVIGEATRPASLAYRHGMTLLDLMIGIGGLSAYAKGNDAELYRVKDGKIIAYPLRIEDLMDDADMTANVDLRPGDVVRIPEAWF